MLRPKNEFIDYQFTTNNQSFVSLADEILNSIGITGYLRNVKRAFLITLLLNLKLNYASNTFVNIPRRPEYYARIPERYKTPKHSYDVTIQVVDGLRSNGFLEYDEGMPKVQMQSCKASQKLISQLNQFNCNIIQSEAPKSFVILRNFDEVIDDYVDVDFHDAYAEQLNEDLKEYDSIRSQAKISLQNIPENIFRLGMRSIKVIAIEDGRYLVPDSYGRYSVELLPTHLVRIFNNDFEHGGRFYRGVESNMKKIHEVVNGEEVITPLRKFLAINGRPTIEYDYKAMHPRLLYHLKGIDYKADPYLIGHNCSKQLRKIYKVVGMVCINSESEVKAVDSIQRELQDSNLTRYLPDNTDATRKKLIQSFTRHNKKIQDYFFTGYGIKLQKIDSDIAQAIIMHFARKGVLVLVIHDSFVIDEKYKQELKKKMKEFYEERMHYSPKIA